MNIPTNIRIALENEKKRFITKGEIFEPYTLYNPCKEYMFSIITAPFYCEAIQLVGEFDKEPGLLHLKKAYAVLGDQIENIDISLFQKIYFDSEDEDITNEKAYGHEYQILAEIYQKLLRNNTDQSVIPYIDFCKKISELRIERKKLIKTKTF